MNALRHEIAVVVAIVFGTLPPAVLDRVGMLLNVRSVSFLFLNGIEGTLLYKIVSRSQLRNEVCC